MKRFCIAFLTVLALVLCIASACFAASNWDPSQGTRDKVKVIPDRVQEGDIAMVYITLTNHTEEALLSPIQLYDPDGNLIGDFDGAILQPGESVSWSEIRTVTEAQMKDRAIRFTAVYRYRDKEGAEKEVRKTLRGNIYPDTKRTPEPTPTSTPEPTPRPEPDIAAGNRGGQHEHQRVLYRRSRGSLERRHGGRGGGYPAAAVGTARDEAGLKPENAGR